MNEKLIDLIMKMFNVESVEDFCTIITRLIMNQTQMVVGFRIHIYDEANDKYFLYFDSDKNKLGWFENECRLSAVKYFSKIVIDTKNELLIQDSHSEQALEIDNRLVNIRRHAMLWEPLIYKKKFVGIISFGAFGDTGFTDETLKFIRIITQILAIKVHEFLTFRNVLESKMNNIYKLYSYKLCEQISLIHGNLELLMMNVNRHKESTCLHDEKCIKYIKNSISCSQEALKQVEAIKNSIND